MKELYSGEKQASIRSDYSGGLEMKLAFILVSLVVVTAVVGLHSANAQSDQAIVKIESNAKWSGSILDSSFDSATKDGHGNTSFIIACTSYGIYSLVIQKQSESGYLSVSYTEWHNS
jgi:hypothetical protein